MITIYKSAQWLLILFMLNQIATAQDFDPMVKAVWKQNKELQARSFELKKAESSFMEAKAMYRPSVNFGAQYTLAYGGRSIALPIGDLFNPVYSTLNQLTGTNNFGSLENVETQFLPNNFMMRTSGFSNPFIIRKSVWGNPLNWNKSNSRNWKLKPTNDCSVKS